MVLGIVILPCTSRSPFEGVLVFPVFMLTLDVPSMLSVLVTVSVVAFVEEPIISAFWFPETSFNNVNL
ncbi:hypothetical protein D3C83_219630 [compost metagenome]